MKSVPYAKTDAHGNKDSNNNTTGDSLSACLLVTNLSQIDITRQSLNGGESISQKRHLVAVVLEPEVLLSQTRLRTQGASFHHLTVTILLQIRIRHSDRVRCRLHLLQQ